MVRACGSYPQRPGFKSLHRHHKKAEEKKIAKAIFFFGNADPATNGDEQDTRRQVCRYRNTGFE